MKARAIFFLLPGGVAAGFATALVDAGVKSGVLLLLAAIAAVALRKSAAATRHLVWTAAMTCALTMPILSLCLPQWRVLPSWMASEPAAPKVGSLTAVLPPLPTGSQVQIQQTSGAENETLTIRNDSPAAATDAESPVGASISMQPIRPDFSGSTAVWLGWAIGAGLLLLRLLRSAWSLHRLSRWSEIVADGMLPKTLKEVAHELRLRRSVTIHVGFADAMPMVWGVWRAHLLLPSSAEQWPPARLRTVMLHELAHVRRRDPLTLMLAQLARAVHWFNPLAWIAVHRLRIEQEQACDDDVLRAGVKPSDYASDVLEIATALRVTPAAGCMALSMASPARLENRLRAIVEAASNRTALTGWTVAGATVAAIALALPLAMVRAAVDKPEAPPPEVTAVEPPPSASTATPAGPPAFGPVVERTIYDVNGSHPDDSFIDLDSGKLSSESALGHIGREEDLPRQVAKAKIDLMGDASGQTFSALGMVVLPTDEKFDSLTVERVDKLLDGNVPSNEPQEVKIPNDLPATYLFKTWEGGRGVLEVLRYNNNYESMSIRYKLVQATGLNPLHHLHFAARSQLCSDCHTGSAPLPNTPFGNADRESHVAKLSVGSARYVFDRQYEREMRSADSRYLDLDTGAFVEGHPPGDLVLAPTESDLRVRAGMELIAVSAPAERWESAKASEVLEALRHALPQKQVRLGGSQSKLEAEPGRTWFVKTREGAAGILQILPRPDSVLVRYKLVRPRREFAHSAIILSSAGGNRFLNLENGQTSASAPDKAPTAYLVDEPKIGWVLRVEDAYNYPTEYQRGRKLWESMTAEEAAEPAGLAAVPPERKGVYPLQRKDLPITILIPQFGLLQVDGFDSRTQSAVLQYKRVTTPAATPAPTIPDEQQRRRSVRTQVSHEALDKREPAAPGKGHEHAAHRSLEAGQKVDAARTLLSQVSGQQSKRSTVPEAARAGETERDGQGKPIDPLTGAANEPAFRGKNVALRDARAVVDEWLAHIAADRTDQMWALTTREQGGLSLDVSKAWAFKSIRAKYVLGNDSAAMVVSARYKDNADRIRVLLCTLVNRDGRWLIHEHLYGNPEDIQLRVAGFAAYPGVRYDVRPEDIVGQWKTVFLGGGSTFHIFKADGSGETQEMKGGQRGKVTAFRWDVQGDVFRRYSGDQTHAGTIVRVDDEQLAVRHGDGQVGYERVPDDSATPRGVRATPSEMPGFIGFAFGPGDFREITSVVDGSPAAAAGLERGDYVVAIDGKPTAEIKNVKEFKTALAGAAGTEVQLSIRQVRSGETVALTLQRFEVPLAPGTH